MAETVKMNPYGYAGDNPVNMVDPTGRDCVSDAFSAVVSGAGIARTFQTLVSFSATQLAGGIGTATTSSAALAEDGSLLYEGVDLAAASQVTFPIGALVDSILLGAAIAYLGYSIANIIQECNPS